MVPARLSGRTESKMWNSRKRLIALLQALVSLRYVLSLSSHLLTIDDFRGACAVKGNVQVAGRTSTTEKLSTHDVTLRNVDGSLFHVQI